MNRLVLFLYLLVMVGCSAPKADPQSDILVQTEFNNPLPEGFELSIEVDHQDTDMYSIMVNVGLENGTYIYSPFSEDETYLHFGMSIPESEFYEMEEAIFEYPNSKEELDPVLNVPVKFVRENTTYIQNINVETTEDFKVTGHVTFLVEPQCIPYDVDFVLTHDNGKLKVTETFIRTASNYKSNV